MSSARPHPALRAVAAAAVALALAGAVDAQETAPRPPDAPSVGAGTEVAAPEPETRVELRLKDGQVLTGTDVRRRQDVYVLSLDGDRKLPVPIGLVAEVKLVTAPRAATGMRKTQGETLPGSGNAGRLPTADELRRELEASAAAFQRNLIDPDWRPESDWTLDPKQNDFSPARWSRSPIDPYWRPTPAYTEASDVTNFSPARWSPSILDPAWAPTDGFLLRDLFWAADPRDVPAPPAEPPEPPEDAAATGSAPAG